MKKYTQVKTKKVLSAVVLSAAFMSGILLSSCSKTSEGDKIIAYVDTDSDKQKNFEITYQEFNSEYLFNLRDQGITEENDENAETCTEIKKQVIEYLTGERIKLQTAEDLNVGVSSLTTEEQNQIITDTDEILANFSKNNFLEEASAELGENATESQISERTKELSEKYFTDVGLSLDTIYIWQRNWLVEQKLFDLITVDVTIDDIETEAIVNDYENSAMESYSSNPEIYNTDYNSQYFYIPENSRRSKIILIAFTPEQTEQLVNLRNTDDNEGADKLRDEFATEIKERAEEAYNKLETDSFDNVRSEYSNDNHNVSYFPDGYLITPESIQLSEEYITGESFIKEIYALEEISARTGFILTDYGYIAAEYSSDAIINVETLNEIRGEIKRSLLENAKNLLIIEKEKEWHVRYPYIIDYEAIGLKNDSDKTDVSE